MVVAQWQHLVDQEHERKVASWLLQVRLHLELLFVLSRRQLHQDPSDIEAFNACHGKKQVFYQKCLLDLNGKGAQMLRSLVSQVGLKLSPVLLVLLNEWLVLIGDVVVSQEGSLEEPVWHIGHCSFYKLEGTVLVNVLAVGAKDQVLLDLAILAEGRLQTNVVKRSDLVSVGDVLDIVDGPLGEPCNAVLAVFVSFVVLNFELAVTFKCQVVAVWGDEAYAMAKHNRLLGLSVIELVNDKFFRLCLLHIFHLSAQNQIRHAGL